MPTTRLDDRFALVTGGTRGLGLGIARRYLQDGATVVCAARNKYDFDLLQAEFGDRAVYEYVDVARYESVSELAGVLVDKYGRIDILVANAGIHRDGKVHRQSPKDWAEVVQTNLTGVFHCTHAFAPIMIEHGAGRIINISSIQGTQAAVGAASYCAAKAGVEMLTRVSALELGHKGVLVNCIAPGFIDAGMGSRFVSENPRAWNRYKGRLALNRIGTIEEIAAAAAFLASDESSYVNGSVLEVSGGLLFAE